MKTIENTIQNVPEANSPDWMRVVINLSKIRISQLVAVSTMLGYILATGEFSWYIIVPTLGAFLLSCGSAALNQYQEWQHDIKMRRTAARPIPSGEIAPREGLLISLGLITAGALVLLFGTNLAALELGLFNVYWYNGVYTPLKRKSAMAVIPGSLIGAVPPAIGWVSGGGYIFDPQIIAVGLFFFIWQIPHFWLLLINLSDDYKKAGFPTLTEKISENQLARMTFFMTLITIVSCLIIPLTGIGASSGFFTALILASGWLAWDSAKLLSKMHRDVRFIRSRFMAINIYMLLVMICFSLDRLI